VRVFKNTWFSRFAKNAGISDETLRRIVDELEDGKWDADLGSGVYKKRIARTGEGKSGGYRTIIFFRGGDRTFFQYGFPKSARDNISEYELREYKKGAKDKFTLTDEQLNAMVERGTLVEIL
jgi:hypothetical protein